MEATKVARRRHGLRASRPHLYFAWKNINSRCYNPDHPQYDDYGGRGIEVYAGWRHDAQAFVAWIDANLGPRPEGKAKDGRALWSLDRIDNSKGYEPGNVRWADPKMQASNRRPRRWYRRPDAQAALMLARADHIFDAVDKAVRDA